jgi:hypothetical protein
MSELSRYFFLAGAFPFIVLGFAHARATPFSVDDRKGLSPSDPTLGAAMGKAHPLLTRRTDIWRAWVSFNLTHSLGAVLFGAFVLILGRNAATFEQSALFALPLSLVTSATYLVLGLNYWFKIPIAGCAIATFCFAVSTLLRLLA